MEVAELAIDRQREEDAGDQEFAHREHVAAHPERRQYLEHMVVVYRAYFEPFAGVERTRVGVPAVGPLRMTIEHPKHLAPVGDATEDLAD